jgi:uncharacterized protein (TIGR02145 family)
MKSKSALLSIVFLLITSSLIAQVTDKDGNSYGTVQIGTQIWTTSNLSVTHFRNGDVIPEAEDSTAWVQANANQAPAWCYYNSDPANGKTYGKLYNWYAVNDSRGLTPNGWHVPTDDEWTNLSTYLGGESVAGTKMKSKSGWKNNGNGTNEAGFAGLPSGYRYYDGSFDYIKQRGGWWSSSEYLTNVWFRYLSYGKGNIGWDVHTKDYGFSVRCLGD